MRHYLAYSIPVALSLLVGCDRDLGECNLNGLTEEGRTIPGPVALDIAYRGTDGLPMYEGQALVESSCGNGQFCHSPAAEGSDRIGVPAGLDFDVSLACNEAVDPSCADPGSCDGNVQSTYCEQLQRLDSNQNRINSWAGGMVAEIRNGAMPPGAAGRRVRDEAPWIRGPRADPEAQRPPGERAGDPLPTMGSGSGEAEEIVRNWLACAAPVVARTELPDSAQLQLTQCAGIDEPTCVYTGPQGALPDSTWSSIYWSLIFTQCVVCHGPLNPNDNADDPNPNNPFMTGQIPGGADLGALDALDLSGSDPTDTTDWASESHAAVFNVPASSEGDCDGLGFDVVVATDSDNSLMVLKLLGTQECGDEMPPAGGVPTISRAVVDVVEEWIDMGAAND